MHGALCALPESKTLETYTSLFVTKTFLRAQSRVCGIPVEVNL